jgi:protein transport protein SEC13
MNTAKVGSIDTKHEGMIHDAQYDYYGKRLATCAADGNIQIFDVAKADLVKGENVTKLCSFKAHNGPIWQLAWAHPKFGNILASCSFDRKVIIWKEVKQNDWQEVTNYEHQGSVNAIAWAPWECGLKLAACSADGTISLLSRKSDDTWENNKFNAHDMGVNCISWAPIINAGDLYSDITSDKNLSPPRLASGSCDKSIKIWEYRADAQTKFQEVAVLKSPPDGHTDWVRDVSWCPNIGAPYDLLVSCSEDQTVIFWRNSKCGESNFKKLDQKKCDGPVWRASWSFAGNLLAISTIGQNSENIVDVYKETENDLWEKVTTVKDDAADSQQI